MAISPKGFRDLLSLLGGFVSATSIWRTVELVAKDPGLVKTVPFWVWLAATVVVILAITLAYLRPGTVSASEVKDHAQTREKLSEKYKDVSTVQDNIDAVDAALAVIAYIKSFTNWQDDEDYRERARTNQVVIDNAAAAVVAFDEDERTRRWGGRALLLGAPAVVVICVCYALLVQATDTGREDPITADRQTGSSAAAA